jgi:3'(2'), 5'-bisphosphate nucleotidase
MRDLKALAAALLPITARAGEAIMRVYAGDFVVERKSDDSPLTLADLESQRVIQEGLARLTPGVPVLSEESSHAPWEERRSWRELWIVDPLDGTREFVKRNGEFTINIALVVNHEPMLGVISAPAIGVVYWGAVGVGAFRRRPGEPEVAIGIARPAQPLRVVGSRSHESRETEIYLQGLGSYVHTGVGSSLKFCLVAEGSADLYPRFGPTSEWDTAAGQAVLESAGGRVTRVDGHRLTYNCRDTLINGDFLAFGHESILPP